MKDINRRTDNRFVYAIGLFCLLSICLSQFPRTTQIEIGNNDTITLAANINEEIL